MSVTLGFLDRWVRNRAEGLENIVGPTARSETRLNAQRAHTKIVAEFSV
jgi:hypothetical protein